jgi:protein-S-isoprenylcysteine O-methyltransferase Ste14
MNPYDAIKWIWIVFGVFWLLAAFAQKRSVRRQSASSRLLQLSVIGVALMPFYLSGGRFGFFGWRVLPRLLPVQYAGVLLLVGGLGFSIWARFALGLNWSGTVTVKEDHVLITRGPYRWVRHPIYTGMLVGLLGTAVVGGTFGSFFAFCMTTLALWVKLRTEEQFMVETFGEQYRAYRRRVKALIPLVL